jgi:exodeoxyribonuclease VII large subunit
MVYELNNYIKKLISGDILLSFVEVEGEISNFTHHYSGHMYFSLKDEKSRIKCIMFATDNKSIDFEPSNGLKVVISGSVSVYEKDGSYQIYVKLMKKQGLGELYKKFNLLKEKLDKEGLFLLDSKKELPYLPKTIGVATSSTGAAVRDIVSVLRRRFPAINILIYPCLVQGDNAPVDIIKSLKYLDKRDDVELIIVGRGGGSYEELFAFNDEELARCIYGLNTPVISAVGHESDFTIADLVADVRAATPSAAAELALPEKNSLKEKLQYTATKIEKRVSRKIEDNCNYLNNVEKRLHYLNPIQKINDKRMNLDKIFKNLDHSIELKFLNEEKHLLSLFNRLNIYDPLLSIQRGYSLVYNQNKDLVKSIESVNVEDDLYIKLKDGIIKTRVLKIKED